MSAQIRFLAFMKKYQPNTNDNGYWEIPVDGRSIGEVLAGTELKACLISYSILVNGMRKEQNYVPAEGDVITLLPMVAGG